jgi:hypothetical protein
MNSATVAAKGGPAFEGTPAQQELAAKAFDLMRRQGMLFAADAPIVVTLDRLVQGLSRSYPKVAADKLKDQVTAALEANPGVFTRQEVKGAVAYETTKSGQRPIDMTDTRHMFRHRLNDDAREVTEQESRTLTEGWIAQAQARAESFTIFQEPAAQAAVSGQWQGPADIAAFVAPTTPAPNAAPMPQPVSPMTPWPQAVPEAEPIAASDVDESVLIDTPEAPIVPESEELPLEVTPAAPPPPAPVEPVAAAPVVEPAAPALAPAVPVAPAAKEAPPAPTEAPPAPVVPARPVRYTLATEAGEATIDLAPGVDAALEDHGATLEAMLAQALRDDFRFASFGALWYPEEHVERFSKGDFRRIKEYLIETQEALSDRAFLNDVLGRRENDPDYERLRFSLNYRMLREKKDFEFVGVPDDHLWIVAGASPVSVPKRKPSELGQDYRFLEDAAIRALEPEVPADLTQAEHALTYYEYENGLLPYDNAMRVLLPRPMLDEQRAALLRIEVPALFQSFPIELRYPTGNRGGYLVGFDAFFQENLVPGATFTLESTEQQNVLLLRFERTSAQEASLLQYDERRNKFVYRPTTYYAGTSPDWLLSEKRFPNLDGVKRLDEAERKKTENVVIRAFELVGEDLDGRFLALTSDLLPVVNLERPFSPGALRAVVETGNHPYFEADPDTPGAFFYDPSKK